MSSFAQFHRRYSIFMIAGVLVFSALSSALLSVYAAADQLTTRSIGLSSSAVEATDVTYDVQFTAIQAAGAFVVDFCSNSPVIGDTCTDPTSDGFSVTSAASTTTNFTDVTGSGHQVVVAGTIDADDNVDVAITGITNPSTAGPLYARIVTFDTKTDAQNYASTSQMDDMTGATDAGGVALSITNDINVSGRVLETMTFCVSGEDPDTHDNPLGAGCTGVVAPTLKLGETSGSTVALSANAVSTGNLYTQLSTNAVGGAAVNLKNDAVCGGLHRAGAAANVCDIAPALAAGVTKGNATFGVKLGTATGDSGTLEAASGSGYNASTYVLNYKQDASTGVTSPYGDPFLDTNNGPASNQTMPLTFGASISNDTPAGNYSADLSMIATGKF